MRRTDDVLVIGPFAVADGAPDSWLGRRNPIAKLVAHLAATLLVTLVFDPLTPLGFIVAGLGAGRLLGRIDLAHLTGALAPVGLLGVALVTSNALFANDPGGATVVWTWGPFTATVEGALIGLALAERMVAVAVLAVLFALTTEPADLARSLEQQARLPARFAYTLLAAYRFAPALRDEYEAIRLAQALRRPRRVRGPLGWLETQRLVLVPLLTGAVRWADRTAVAMDSRGFGSRRRTHYRRLAVDRGDVALVIGAIAAGALILACSAAAGVLRVWTGTLTT